MLPLLLILQVLLRRRGTTGNTCILMTLLALLWLSRWLLLLLLLRNLWMMDHLRRIEEWHWLTMGCSISWCTNMTRNWKRMIWTILQNCQILSFTPRHICVVEAHCWGCCCCRCCCCCTNCSRIWCTWWSSTTGSRRLYRTRSDRSSCNCLLLAQRENERRTLKFNTQAPKFKNHLPKKARRKITINTI